MRSHAKTQRRKGGRGLGGLFQFQPVGLDHDLQGQNYGAGYLFLSLKSFASWRLERSGRETDRKLLFDVEGKGRMRSHAKTQRRKGGRGLGGLFQFQPVGLDHGLQGKTMGQAIYFSPLNPLRLCVLSEAGVRLIGNYFLTRRAKLWGMLFISLPTS
jgi:hypothetical protein